MVRGAWTCIGDRGGGWFIKKINFLFGRDYLGGYANICSLYMHFHFVVPRIGSIRGFPNEASSYLYHYEELLASSPGECFADLRIRLYGNDILGIKIDSRFIGRTMVSGFRPPIEQRTQLRRSASTADIP